LYIRQSCLFSFDEIMKLQPETRLEKMFSTLDLEPIINNLKGSRWGPHGYNLGPKIRALLAMVIESITTFTALVERLKQDPVFRYSCGFSVAGQTPSISTFSRLFTVISDSDVLQQYFQELVEQLRELKVIDNEYAAIDASKLESKERAEPKKNIEQDGTCPDWGSKKDSHGNQITWFGWKVHISVDCKSELPLAVEVTPASRPDGLEALSLVEQTTHSLDKKDQPKYWAMEHLNMKNLNVRGIKKAKARVLLSCIAMLGTALLSAYSLKDSKQAA